MIAYHFTNGTLRDGRPLPPIGEKLVHEGELVPCRSGLHASPLASDAIKYAVGGMLDRVLMSGEIIKHGDDKVVATERTRLATIDAEYLLRRFAADQALSVSHLWSMPPIVREYLTTLDESKRAGAQDAAWDARAAERAAERAAAWGAAWSAVQVASWGAARAALDAAWSAARAARGAERAAAWDAQAAARGEFNARVDAAFAEREAGNGDRNNH